MSRRIEAFVTAIVLLAAITTIWFVVAWFRSNIDEAWKDHDRRESAVSSLDFYSGGVLVKTYRARGLRTYNGVHHFTDDATGEPLEIANGVVIHKGKPN